MRYASLGFSTDAIVSGVDLFSGGYNLERAKIFHTQLLDRVRTLPGVESAALTRVYPFSYSDFSSAPIEVYGFQPPPNQQPTVEYYEVKVYYFTTLGIAMCSCLYFISPMA